MTPQLVLSLFPGIGLLDMAFEQEGFCVVRGPDVLWGGDIRRFHPPADKFDGVIGGPPCQCFSRLANMVRQNGYQPKFGNLIPEFERCVTEASPQWFLMENVPDAPPAVVQGYAGFVFLLNNRQLGETQNRVRRWTWGWRGRPEERPPLMIETVALESMKFEYAATGANCPRPIAIGGSCTKQRKNRFGSNPCSHIYFDHLCRLQGLANDFDLPGFTVAAKCKAVGNGVPLAMGRAIARAVARVV